MAEIFLTAIGLQMVTCSECGISFGIPRNMLTSLLDTHRKFYCPNGHAQFFPWPETDVKR